MFFLKLLVCSIILSFVTSAFAEKSTEGAVYFYEPLMTDLTGTVEMQTFPGPPNYMSIFEGDILERGWYLRLENKIEVFRKVLNRENIEDIREKNVDILQLAFDTTQANWKITKRLLSPGAKIKVTGRLFHSWSGHHHSRVLISVSKVERIEMSR
jgi:hypothetical protein